MAKSMTGRGYDNRGLRLAIYFPFVYPWVLDLTHELSLKVNNEVRYYTTGAYGNYPWTEYEKHAYSVPRFQVLGETIPHPRLFFSFCRYRPRLLLLFATESLTSLLLCTLCRLLGGTVIPVVEQNSERRHSNPLLAILAKIKKWFVKQLHRGAKLIIAESDASREYLIRMGCSDERIRVIPHGTNTNYFQPKPRNIELAKRIGVSAEDLKKVIVLFAGEFSEYKGAQYLTEAAFDLFSNSSILFLIPGFGPVFLQHKELLEKSGNVRVYPPVRFGEMVDLYCLSDIVIVPSKRYEAGLSDPSPNSLIEGMACARAVVASNCGGIPSIMGDAGVLIPPNDPKAIVDAVVNLASDEELIKELGNKARERAVKVLSNEVYAQSILNLWSQNYTR